METEAAAANQSRLSKLLNPIRLFLQSTTGAYYYYKYKVIKIACYIYLGLYKYLCATRRLERVLSEPVCSNLPEEHCMMIWNLGQQMPPLQTLGGVGPNSSYRR